MAVEATVATIGTVVARGARRRWCLRRGRRWRWIGCARRRWGRYGRGRGSGWAGLWSGLRRWGWRGLRLGLGAGRSGRRRDNRRRGRRRRVRSGNGQWVCGRRWVRGPIDRYRLSSARLRDQYEANAQADQGQGHQGHGHRSDHGREPAQRPSVVWIVGGAVARIDQPPICCCSSEDTPAALPPSTGEERIWRARGDSKRLEHITRTPDSLGGWGLKPPERGGPAESPSRRRRSVLARPVAPRGR